jgi:hypothetical protein
VQSDPLRERDHFIDVRKLLAKSGSPSRRRLASIGTSFDRQHCKATSFRSIAGGPSVRRQRSSPPASIGSGRTSTSPNDLAPNNMLCPAADPSPIAGTLGRDEGAD